MSTPNWTLEKTLPYILTAAGIIGVFCAFVLSQDKLKLLEHPGTQLSCSLDPILACGSVIQSNQAHAIGGVPNPFLGLAGYAALATIGVAILAGAKFKRWFWLAVEGGLLFALGFVHWLFFQSVYRIHNLCVYCMVVWVVTITSFWYVTLYNFDQKNLKLPKGTEKIYARLRRHHLDVLILWLLIIAGLVLKHFWYYYGRKF